MLAWMLYVLMVTLLLCAGAFLAERVARLRGARTRGIWIAAILASLLLPSVIASISVQVPDLLNAPRTQAVIELRNVTSQRLSPVTWIAGSAEQPRGWREIDPLLIRSWITVSIGMLLALLVSGARLMRQKRTWDRATVLSTHVYITEDVGPAVVGLLRPSIVMPRWLTHADPSRQAAVLAHEQSHLDARDPQLFTLALGLLVFMPWNLPLWWQLRRLRWAIEVDCDARVLKSGLDVAHYGETLISVGERQSVYIGAVAAMSESRSFLEERLRIMVNKPVKWRRFAIVALGSMAVAVTALAVQVSPPNAAKVPASAAPAAQAAPAAPAAQAVPAAQAAPAVPPTATTRKVITLDNAVLDRYVGDYQLSDQAIFRVKREGAGLQAQVTGQPWVDIYPESETKFFYKVVDAQLEFATDGSSTATSVTLHQNGHDHAAPRIDAATAAQVQANLDAKVQSQSPTPGSEAALQHLIAGLQSGKPDYDSMSPQLADVTRQQLPKLQASLSQLGPVRTVDFRGVSPSGWDVYEVRHDKGLTSWKIHLGSDGRTDGALVMPGP
ncbi:MAG TPA: M56 family metallopeptidase [Povalibacter sp.]|nr:M56 family metallopeptidase [Povalibacter sp.]